MQMTYFAVQGNPDFEVSDIEIRRSGLSYTINTVSELASLHPGAALGLIIGTDNLMEFQTWKSPQEILAQVQLVVVNRPGFARHDARSEFARLSTFVNVPQIGISSTDIRRRVKLRRSIRYLVPPQVEEYIHQRNLYRD
ncbi:MAG: nicotinate (nicotinamide) nucleotide adenylyltransferase [Ignavibacteriae bacterium]|nr:nicotinate (nicotinamide) nucleotide adenylyltransferase [Ignavibacteriota bacterium]